MAAESMPLGETPEVSHYPTGIAPTLQWNATWRMESSSSSPDDPRALTPAAISFAVLMSVCIVTTVVGNILVVLSIFTYRPLRSVQNYYIVSLAVADLAVALFVMPFHVANSVTGHWLFGAVLCNLWLTFDILMCTASILNLCAIAGDRYCAVHDPINYAQKRTLRRVLVAIVVVWAASAVISIPPLFGWNNNASNGSALYNEENRSCRLTDEPGFVVYSASGSFFIPLAIMVFLYAKIYLATRQRLRRRSTSSSIKPTRCSERPLTPNDPTPPPPSNAGALPLREMCRAALEPLTRLGRMAAERDRRGRGSGGGLEEDGTEKRKRKTALVGRSTVDDKEEMTNRQNGEGGGGGGGGVSEKNYTNSKAKKNVADKDNSALDGICENDNTDRSHGPQQVSMSTEGPMNTQGLMMGTQNPAIDDYTSTDKTLHNSNNGDRKTTVANRQSPRRTRSKTKDSIRLVSKKHSAATASSAGRKELRPPKKSTAVTLLRRRLSQRGDGWCPPLGDARTQLLVSGSELRLGSQRLDSRGSQLSQIMENRQKMLLAKERRTARTMAVIMGVFVLCWLPFFLMYVVFPFCSVCRDKTDKRIQDFIVWLGYINSTLNPIIYTIFNIDFRRAFKSLLQGNCRLSSS